MKWLKGTTYRQMKVNGQKKITTQLYIEEKKTNNKTVDEKNERVEKKILKR